MKHTNSLKALSFIFMSVYTTTCSPFSWPWSSRQDRVEIISVKMDPIGPHGIAMYFGAIELMSPKKATECLFEVVKKTPWDHQTIKRLIDAGADITARDPETGMDILFSLFLNSHKLMSAFMKKHGAELSVCPPLYPFYSLDVILAAPKAQLLDLNKFKNSLTKSIEEHSQGNNNPWIYTWNILLVLMETRQLLGINAVEAKQLGSNANAALDAFGLPA